MATPPDGPEGFQQLFERQYRPIFRFFERRGFAVDSCHDLAQETFLRAYRGWEGFRGDANRTTWLFQIATNTFVKEIKRRKADKRSGTEISLSIDDPSELESLLGEAQEDEGRQPLDRVLGRERLADANAVVASLPDQMRTCLLLRVRQGLSNKEIATVLQVSAQTVKAHLFQARRRLKAALATPEDEG